jgi:hypothetical protein
MADQKELPFEIEEAEDDGESPDFESSGRGRTSRFQPILDKWKEENYLEEGKKMYLYGMTEAERNNLRNLFYRYVDKSKVIVRSSKQDEKGEDGEDLFDVCIRRRRGDEYTRG